MTSPAAPPSVTGWTCQAPRPTRSALRPDGTELAVGGSREAGIQVWDLDPEQWVAAACRLAGRNLTAEEWSTNLADLAAYRATCPQFEAAV